MTALTNEEFLRRCKEIHGNRYKYLDGYKGGKIKIRIECQEHGIFLQAAGKHLIGQNCPKCAMISGKNKSKKTNDQFIKDAIKLHGNKYDYSRVNYINAKTKVIICCKDCNKFFDQTPNSHLGKRGCPTCKSLTKEKLLEKVREIHEDKYEYILEKEIVHMRDNIKIRCKECNITFEQNVNNHLRGYGHSVCGMKKAGINKRKSFEQFSEEATNIHGNKFEYNKDTYTISRTNMEIKCLKCGTIFKQTPDSHLRTIHACPECSNKEGHDKLRKDKDILIGEFKEAHGDSYDYSLVEYINSYTKIKIICNTCKNIFEQQPGHHRRGTGCIYCLFSRGEKQILRILKDKGILSIPQFELPSLKNRYYDYNFKKANRKIIFEYDGIQHFEETYFFDQILEEIQLIDIIKTHAAIKAGYTVIRIDYTIEFEDLEKIMDYAFLIPENCNLYISNPKLYSWLVEGVQYLEDVL